VGESCIEEVKPSKLCGRENRGVGNSEWTVPKVTYINFLLNNISIHTGHQEMRENALIFYQILSPSFLRNVWRSVRGICVWILVLKELSSWVGWEFGTLETRRIKLGRINFRKYFLDSLRKQLTFQWRHFNWFPHQITSEK